MRKIDVWPLLTPEMQAVVRKDEELAAALPPDPSTGHPLPRMRRVYNEAQRYWNAEPLPIARVEDFSWDCGLGTLDLRLYHPAPGEPRPLLVYLHGGGYVLGNLDTHDCVMRHLCGASDWAVLGVDYSLSPEARFPRQIEEIAGLMERLEALSERRDCDSRTVAFAGDSAGAHLCIASCLELRGRGLALPSALFLFYGGFGLEDSYSQRFLGGPLDGLARNEREFYRNAYCRRSQRDDPRYDVLNADLAGMPPSYLLTLSLDPLDDDSRALARSLNLAEVPNVLRRRDGVLHGFLKNARELSAAREVIAEVGEGLGHLRRGQLLSWMETLAKEPAPSET